MSFDFRLKNTCNHQVIDEILQVDDDLRSVRFDRPPTATRPNQLTVKVNGFIIDPDTDPQFAFTLVKDETFVVPLAISNLRGPRIQNKKKIYFKKPVRSQDNIFEVSYYTDEANCRRCHGLRIEDDIRFSIQGKPLIVEDNQKLIQDVNKFVFTILGSNPFHELIGTNAFLLIGEKFSNLTLTSLKLQQEITTTLQVYLERQISQATVQEVTDAEFLYKIISVDIQRNDQDPSIVDVRVVFSNRTFGESEISEEITIPGFNSALFGDARKTFGLTEAVANNSRVPTFPDSPVERFRSLP